jgi:hypothetical protein
VIEMFDRLWAETRPAFAQQRTWWRARSLALGALVGMGRRTVSGMLTATGQQFDDWSAAYRLFAKARFDLPSLLAPARRTVVQQLAPQQPLVALMDDTLLRKRGRKISGTSWRRDPLGPPFCNNFIWGQRFLQISAALPEGSGAGRARAIPIDLTHCPSPRKPHRNAPDHEWTQYRADLDASRISLQGAERIAALRAAMDCDGQQDRLLIMAVDGSYTNSTVMRMLPERTTLIGRVRKDAKLFRPPEQAPCSQRGRKRFYGSELPTPEQLRQDPDIPWQKVQAFGAGRLFDFEVKSIGPVRWRGAGKRDLRLIIVRPLAYRPQKGAHLLYRDPAYLLCTDPQMDLATVLQAYLWRWEIEVNFRDEKTLLGMGQAQVRTPEAVEHVPGLIAAAYAFMHLSLHLSPGQGSMPMPCWQRPQLQKRQSSAQTVNLFRVKLWGKALGIGNLTDFAKRHQVLAKSDKCLDDPASAMFYAAT